MMRGKYGCTGIPGICAAVRILLTFVLTLSFFPASGSQLRAQQDGASESLDIRTPEFAAESTGNPRWQREIQRIGAGYVRLHIADVQAQQRDDLVLELRDRNGRRIREYSASELLDRAPFWTAVIPGDYVLVSLFSERPPVGFHLSIDRLAYQAYSGAPLSTWGADEKEPIANFTDDAVVFGVQRPVARLLFMDGGVPATCTGFLVTSGRLVTNHHCVQTQEVCDSLTAFFGYQYDKNGLLHFGEQYECARVVPDGTSFDLDYAMLDLRGNPAVKWGTLDPRRLDPEIGDPLFIVQHPGGHPKQISMVNCAAKAVPVDGRGSETDFTHTCDTVKGSSGSPVFDAQGRLVGLHHYGFADGGEWSENRAIRMTQIVEDIAD